MNKLGVDYCVFEGISELLPYSIKQIRSHVNFINISYQLFSYFGNEKIKEEDLEILFKLKRDNIIESLILYEPQKYAENASEAKLLEKEKRNLGRKICFNQGCNYFLEMDVDEFYKEDEFKFAKDYVINNQIKYSAVEIVDYFKLPILKSKYLNDCIVPFICFLDESKEMSGAKFLGKVDPTRGYNISFGEKTYSFKQNEIMMHHMMGVRKDLYLKWKSTSRGNMDRNRINEMVTTINSINKDNLNINSDFKMIGNEFEIVDNYFNIPLEQFYD